MTGPQLNHHGMHDRFTRRAGIAAAVTLLLTLSACGGEQGELQAWMDQERQQVKPNVQQLSPPQKFNPQAYAGMDGVEPFSTQKLTGAIKQEARQPNSAVAAELNRRKEPLEAYPLDSMTMVGSVNKNGRPYALLKVENLLYQVKAGDYIGQNYGKILTISETEISLREIVQDAAGEWIERPTTLQLQEGGK
jgi:type IV pilus assembly protein PilP